MWAVPWGRNWISACTTHHHTAIAVGRSIAALLRRKQNPTFRHHVRVVRVVRVAVVPTGAHWRRRHAGCIPRSWQTGTGQSHHSAVCATRRRRRWTRRPTVRTVASRCWPTLAAMTATTATGRPAAVGRNRYENRHETLARRRLHNRHHLFLSKWSSKKWSSNERPVLDRRRRRQRARQAATTTEK